jgi:hypothetical protein
MTSRVLFCCTGGSARNSLPRRLASIHVYVPDRCDTCQPLRGEWHFLDSSRKPMNQSHPCSALAVSPGLSQRKSMIQGTESCHNVRTLGLRLVIIYKRLSMDFKAVIVGNFIWSMSHWLARTVWAPGPLVQYSFPFTCSKLPTLGLPCTLTYCSITLGRSGRVTRTGPNHRAAVDY